jgi:chemotaxis protein CheZ
MGNEEGDLYVNVGRLTRQLHDALRELGYDVQLENAVGSLPDARNRLSYVSRLTGQAAEKVLNGVDRTKAELQHLSDGATEMAAALRADPVGAVASGRMMGFLDEVGASASRADAQLTEIMLAQDFHDLTGQVIRKVVTLAQGLEAQLVQLLVQTRAHEAAAARAAEPVRAEPPRVEPPRAEALEGPAVMTAGRTDVVNGQAQVDELLESLGF